MTKLPHFFLVYSIIINSFLFLVTISLQMLPPSFLSHSLLPLFFFFFKCSSSSLHMLTEERRRTAPNGPIPAACSGGWKCGEGWGVWRCVGKCFLFSQLEAKSLKGVHLLVSRWGQKSGRVQGLTEDHKQTWRRVGLLCASGWCGGALLEVIFESTLPSLLPSFLPVILPSLLSSISKTSSFFLIKIEENEKATD